MWVRLCLRQYSAVQQEFTILPYRESDAQSQPWPSRLLSCILVKTDLLRVVFWGLVVATETRGAKPSRPITGGNFLDTARKN
jgi:hypothetical protein